MEKYKNLQEGAQSLIGDHNSRKHAHMRRMLRRARLRPTRKQLVVVVITVLMCLGVFYLYSVYQQKHLQERMRQALEKYAHKYLFEVPGCRVRDVDPFDEVILEDWFRRKEVTCDETRNFIYETEVVGDRTCPLLNERVLWVQYHLMPFNLQCTYQEVVVDTSEEVKDSSYKLLPQKTLGKSCPEEMHIWISCNIAGEKYEQPLLMTKVLPTGKTLEPQSSEESPYHVLVLGIDSLSRLAFHRSLPNTYRFLQGEYGDHLLELLGYNKVGENSTPNQIPLLSGHTFHHETDMNDGSYFDNFTRYIWQDFRDRGYRTMFFEETWNFGLFTYPGRKGFFNTPTEYWPRPLMVKTDIHRRHLLYLINHYMDPCVGGHQPAKYYLDYVWKTLQVLGRRRPLFSYAWFSEATHDDAAGGMHLDEYFFKFFKNMKATGLLDDTIILFASDHGYRMAPYRNTPLGHMEDTLPFGFFLLPQKFIEDHPKAVEILKINSKRLVTAYDLHATLLELSGNKSSRSTATRHGISLISNEVPDSRTCHDALISETFCSCYQSQSRSESTEEAKTMGHALISEVNRILEEANAVHCAMFDLKGVSRIDELYSGGFSTHLFQVSVDARPAPSSFEGIVKKSRQGLSLVSSVLRIDRYSTHSHCANGKIYEKYCYCK